MDVVCNLLVFLCELEHCCVEQRDL